MTTKTDLVHRIGGAILRRANADGEAWDYAGWVFETSDGDSYQGELFRYVGERRLLLDIGVEQRPTAKALFRLREITAGDDGKPWIKCLVAVRRADKALRMYFEFEDEKRWRINPANTENARQILLGEAFPETNEDLQDEASR